MARRIHTLVEFLIFDSRPRKSPPPSYQAYEVEDDSSRCGFVDNPSTLDVDLDREFEAAFQLDPDPEDTAINVRPPWVRPDTVA